jgi:hypothetical protein
MVPTPVCLARNYFEGIFCPSCIILGGLVRSRKTLVFDPQRFLYRKVQELSAVENTNPLFKENHLKLF